MDNNNFIQDYLESFDSIVLPYMGWSSNIDYYDAYYEQCKYIQFYAYLRSIDRMIIESEHILYLIRCFSEDDIYALLDRWYQTIKSSDKLLEDFISILVYFDIDEVVGDYIFAEVIEAEGLN